MERHGLIVFSVVLGSIFCTAFSTPVNWLPTQKYENDKFDPQKDIDHGINLQHEKENVLQSNLVLQRITRSLGRHVRYDSRRQHRRIRNRHHSRSPYRHRRYKPIRYGTVCNSYRRRRRCYYVSG